MLRRIARNPLLSRQIRNHHALSGFGCSLGVALVTLLAWAVADTRTAIAMAAGALIVSLTDIPVPRRNKLPLQLANLLQMPAVALIVLATHHSAPLLGAAVLLITFASAMATAWGKPGLPLGYGMMMVMAFTLAQPDLPPREQAMHLALQFTGGLCYLAYAVGMARLTDTAMRRRALVDALYAFADYVRGKAALFDPARDLDEVYAELVRRQAVFGERLQTARDFVLVDHCTPEQQALANGLLALIDAHEAVLASQGDYAPLREAFGDHRVLRLLAAMTRTAADDVLRLAHGDLSGRDTVLDDTPYRNTRPALDIEVAALAADTATDRSAALAVLEAGRRKLLGAIDGLRRVDRALREPVGVDGADMGRFLSRSSFAPRALSEALHADSPVLRYALRLTLAMAAAFTLSQWLPWASHGYWILLTVSLVMRASFSQTKQRQTDRMVGNALGCLFVAAVLHWVSAPEVLLGIVFVCIGIAHAFITVRYRVTVTAACVMSLLQLHLIAPGSFHISERFLDTAVGVAIAWLFSRVLPTWERNTVPALATRLLGALRDYVSVALVPDTTDLNYRLARRQVQDALAALSDAAARMRDEPASEQLPLAPINALTTRGYLLLAHLAAARRLTARSDPTHAATQMEGARRELNELLSSEQAVLTPDALIGPLANRLNAARVDARAVLASARELGIQG
ncbi:FUSC family protein [Methyloversatilis universalis]|uniref:FUSC family protein n=1 Tax=Methyloversatilis universalis TaxID=378211 RepID=UPI000378A1CB|nr:FUSC family membrane protein [Methyloversatilis universalis]